VLLTVEPAELLGDVRIGLPDVVSFSEQIIDEQLPIAAVGLDRDLGRPGIGGLDDFRGDRRG